MFIKFPKNEGAIRWTKHAQRKLRQYQLSEKRVLRVLRKPDRKEEGIAPGTLANMQRTGTKKHPTEIWIMYQIINPKSPEAIPSGRDGAGKIQNPLNAKHYKERSDWFQIKIISAWRYPAISPKGKPLPIPVDVLQDLMKEGLI